MVVRRPAAVGVCITVEEGGGIAPGPIDFRPVSGGPREARGRARDAVLAALGVACARVGDIVPSRAEGDTPPILDGDPTAEGFSGDAGRPARVDWAKEALAASCAAVMPMYREALEPSVILAWANLAASAEDLGACRTDVARDETGREEAAVEVERESRGDGREGGDRGAGA